MRLKMSFTFLLAIFIITKSMARSESYTRKKDNAPKTTSPFELIATHQKKDVVLEYEDDELIVFEPSNDKQQIADLLQTFMKCIETKDSLTLYSLFADVPVTWVGVWQPVTQKTRTEANALAPSYKVSDYKSWFRNIMKEGNKAELFSNPVIVEDGTIGSVTFDYSFWVNNKKGNWGKESWGLIKLNDKWKIASVLFSMELEKIRKQPEGINDSPSTKHKVIEKYIQSFKDTTHFQGTVLIAKGDSIIHHAAYGLFDVENKVPNSLNTQFLIGSLTKSFVAIAIMQLVEKGLIDLNAPLQQYIPKLKPELANNLTVHHLLKQQSGLAASLDDLTDYEVMDILPSELLDIINKSKKSFNPGEKHQYSNINYCLLGMVIEQVSGKTYQSYLQENIFQPAGMTNTGIERLLNIPPNKAVGYRMINAKIRRVQNVVSYAFGSGDIYATAMDLHQWSKALHNRILVNANSMAKMFDGGTKDWGYYGYGFRIQQYQRSPFLQTPGTLIRHGGTMNGYTSNYHYYKEDNLTIIILTNYRNIPIRSFSYNLKEIVLESEPGKRKNILAE